MAESFLHGNGGDNPLNFKVVGNPQPQNPKENTIWIDTDMKVTGYQFSSEYRGKNLLKNTAQSQTINGVTFTVNEDGSVTVNGTATNSIYFYLIRSDSYSDIVGKVISGCNGGSNGTYGIYVTYYNSQNTIIQHISNYSGSTVVPTNSEAKYFDFYIYIWKGFAANNLTFYPMIRLATETDDTYEPYGVAKEGFVWIKTGTESNSSFNALKKNNIQIYPAAAKQYVSGKWVDKTAKIYKNGKWVELIPNLYIVENGTLKQSLSGDGSITQQSGYVRFSSNGNAAHIRYIIVDVTDFKTLHITIDGILSWEENQTPGIGISKSVPGYDRTYCTVDSYIRVAILSSVGHTQLDVSDLSGSVCIWLTVSGSASFSNQTGYMHIKDLHLE